MTRKLLLVPAYLSFVFNFAVLTSVAANLGWVHTRAAGGSFSDFPFWVRVAYAFQALVMVALAVQLSRTTRRWAQLLAGIFTISAAIQLLSRSTDERWNVIPAATIALTYLWISRGRVNRVVEVQV